MDNIQKMEELERICLRTIRDYSWDTVYFKDINSKYIWNSKKHAEQFGLENPLEMRGKSDFDYFPADFAETARAVELDIISSGKPDINRLELLEVAGKSEYYLSSKYPLYGDNNEIIGTWGISRNITDQKNIEKELEHTNRKLSRLARIDDLSGLYNRRFFYESLSSLVDSNGTTKGGDKLALIAIDMDNLKTINDKYGHPHGDDAIRLMASALKTGIRGADSCFRVGGDEFMVLLPGRSLQEAKETAQRISDIVKDSALPFEYEACDKLTISQGVAVISSGMSSSDLISAADHKLYEAKMSGKNAIVV